MHTRKPPRRYLQGTLDFACGVYAVINALNLVHGLDLAGARRIFAETNISLAACPGLWPYFVRNETDHYWLVRHMLNRWCRDAPYALKVDCPFDESGAPSGDDRDLSAVALYLPERHDPAGPASLAETRSQASSTWECLSHWFRGATPGDRTAILRFHRFLPNIPGPIISHWTTVGNMDKNALHLHDASSEAGALLSLEYASLLGKGLQRPLLRIVPESLFLLERG